MSKKNIKSNKLHTTKTIDKLDEQHLQQELDELTQKSKDEVDLEKTQAALSGKKEIEVFIPLTKQPPGHNLIKKLLDFVVKHVKEFLGNSQQDTSYTKHDQLSQKEELDNLQETIQKETQVNLKAKKIQNTSKNTKQKPLPKTKTPSLPNKGKK